MDDSWISVARTPRRQTIEDLALVLTAEGIPCEVHMHSGWVLSVPLHRFGDAAAALAAFESEQHDQQAQGIADLDRGPSQIGIAIALVLLAFHAGVSLSGGHTEWLRHGRVSAGRILDGELWRCVTGLTLHVGAFHVASNAAASAVFGNFLGRMLGHGVTLCALLLAGAAGNLLNVLWQGAPHLSVGASTSVFGAVGLLAGLQAQRYRDRPAFSRRAWVPIAGSVALLAMLGASPQSDFAAHVFGLVAGIGIGIGLDRAAAANASERLQTMLLASALLVVVACWGFAWMR